MTPALFSADMKPLRVSSLIGRGGEGEVYALHGIQDQVVKLYTVADTQSREAKIEKMIADGLSKLTPLIAFPVAIIRNKAGAFVGFTMMKFSGHQPLHELYAPGARKISFPRADYRFLVRTAANVARAVASAHGNNCVIGDINHSGILISEQATAALIDADSFQIVDGGNRYCCKVGTPEYTPPELQGASLDGALRTKNHDAFGLAVVIFQLLWMGRHPYSGRYTGGDMPLEKAIREFRFAYSSRETGMQRPPAVPQLKDFSPAIEAAFEQAFGPQGTIERPSPKQWIALLQEFERSLVKCTNNPLHYHAQQTAECPWCRMERMFGVPLFIAALPDFTHTAAFVPMSGDMAAMWRAIEAVGCPANENPKPKLLITPEVLPTNEARVASSKRLRTQLLGAALLGIAAATLFAWPSYFIFALVAGGTGINRLLAKHSSFQVFESRYREIEGRRLKAEQEWKDRAGLKEFNDLRSRLAAFNAEYYGLAAEEKRQIQEHQSNRRSDQLRTYLEGFPIRRARIGYVGPAKLAMLTSYGIETAADISAIAVQNVPGFGPVNSRPLIEWRAGLERKFVYNANPTQADAAAIGRIRAEIATRAAQLKAELGTGPERLRRLGSAIQQLQQTVDPILQHLTEQSAQALVDLRWIGLSPPDVKSTPSAKVHASPPSAGPSNSGLSLKCPRCGSPMISRTAHRGRNAGGRFLGCTRYPLCKGTRPVP